MITKTQTFLYLTALGVTRKCDAKLSKAQQELVDAMKRGVRVHFMDGVDALFFGTDTHKVCSHTALILERKGVAERRVTHDNHKQLFLK